MAARRRRSALPLPPGKRTVRAERRSARRRAGVAAPVRGRRGRPMGGRADRRPRRPDAHRRALRVGYARSRAGVAPAPLAAAIASAPPRGRPHRARARAWRGIVVDRAAGTIRRPAGVGIDTGGTGKGLAADAVTRRLRRRAAVRGRLRRRRPRRRGGGRAPAVRGRGRAPAHRRAWRTFCASAAAASRRPGSAAGSGGGRMAASRTISSIRPRASRRGPACSPRPRWPRPRSRPETLAKAALLSGPVGARRVLAVGGGVIVHDDGDVELVGPVAPPRCPGSPCGWAGARRHDRP